jgi:hypothetical protein
MIASVTGIAVFHRRACFYVDDSSLFLAVWGKGVLYRLFVA